MILLNNDISSIFVGIEMGRLVFDNLKKVILYLMPVSHFFRSQKLCCLSDWTQAGTYTEFMTVFANVFLGMQIAHVASDDQAQLYLEVRVDAAGAQQTGAQSLVGA